MNVSPDRENHSSSGMRQHSPGDKSTQVSHLIMMSTNAVKEKTKRENSPIERKKVQPINSDLGEIITAR